MRLHNIYYVCKTYITSVEKLTVTYTNDRSIVCIENWKYFIKTLNELYKLQILKKDIDSIYNSVGVYDRTKDKLDLPRGNYDNLEKNRNTLVKSMRTIIELYELMDVSITGSGIDVKIPQCVSLKEYTDYLKDIDFIFTQCPYLLSKDEEIKFKGVDVGSQWLTFMVVSGGAFYILNNLAKLIKKAIALRSYMATYKMQEEMLHTMELKNEVADGVVEAFSAMKHTVIKQYVGELKNDIGELKDGEEEGKVEKSLEKLVDLMEKGVEIYSSIETPNEIKTLFPQTEDNPVLPDNLVKMLEDKLGDKKE